MAPTALTPTSLAYRAAVLTGECDGYAAGTAGIIAGSAQGCLIFAPDDPKRVAAWARPRATLLVPAALLAIESLS